MQGVDFPTSGALRSNSCHLPFALLISVVFHIVLLSVVGDTPDQLLAKEESASSRLAVQIVSNAGAEIGAVSLESVRQYESAVGDVFPASSSGALEGEAVPPRLAEVLDPNLMNVEGKGRVELVLRIDRYGTARSVSVRKSTVPKEIEAQVVLRLFRAKYEPATREGMPVDGSLTVEVQLDTLNPAMERY